MSLEFGGQIIIAVCCLGIAMVWLYDRRMTKRNEVSK